MARYSKCINFNIHWLEFVIILILKLDFFLKILNCLSYVIDLLNIHPASFYNFQSSKLKHRADKSFALATPRLWNMLPLNVCITQFIQSFKYLFKTHLFFHGFWLIEYKMLNCSLKKLTLPFIFFFITVLFSMLFFVCWCNCKAFCLTAAVHKCVIWIN